jgi:hypothetical protein
MLHDLASNGQTRAAPGAPAMADIVSDVLISFARTGVPAAESLPAWPRFTNEKRSTMIFDLPCRVEDDPRSAERSLFGVMPDPPSAASTVSHAGYDLLRSYVGGTWSGPIPPGPDGVAQRFEIQFLWANNLTGFRFESAIVRGEQRLPWNSGMYGWNPATGKWSFVQTNANGALQSGTMHPEGEAGLASEVDWIDADGKSTPTRSVLKRESPDICSTTFYQLKDGAWKLTSEVRLERHR